MQISAFECVLFSFNNNLKFPNRIGIKHTHTHIEKKEREKEIHYTDFSKKQTERNTMKYQIRINLVHTLSGRANAWKVKTKTESECNKRKPKY